MTELARHALPKTLPRVGERIERAAGRAGRQPEEITLVGVSKTFPAERIREAFAAGVRHFGESRMQEWEAKAPHLAGLERDLASGRAPAAQQGRRAAALFQEIDSLDSLPLAEKLERGAGDGRRLPVLIEVRLDPAAKKSGCEPEELPRLAEGLLLMPHLDLRGLMTVPPLAG